MKIENNIPGFKLHAELHEGGHTLVYRAIREKDGNPVVLKTLVNPYPDPAEIAMLTKEYEILTGLDVEGVNQACELVLFNNRPVLVTEDFVGCSLAEYLREKGPLPMKDFLEIAIRLARVLSRIHARNVMHKDLNPGNILIDPKTGDVRVIDFGLSTRLSRERTSVRNPNVLEGTLQYISPEQTGRMNRSTDYRTDLYSLGITYHLMLTGELPFTSEDAMELVHCHIAKMISPLDQRFPGIPKTISDIILKLTSKIAEDRYQSAEGLAHDLELCRVALLETGTIPPMNVGEHDAFSRFKIPERLYGREREVEALMAAFEDVAIGGCRLMLVSGFSGIGKTALVNEIHKPTVRRNGYFISGKFDQFKSNIPFNAFSHAFKDLLGQLVSEPKQRLDIIKSEMATALGLNAAILIDLIPEFEVILGKPDGNYTLKPAESQNRFFFTLRDFIRVLATSEHPLTIFLDDLQWCDDASLSLIRELIIKGIPHLFLICAYRKHEVGEGHPVALTLEEIARNVNIDEVTLSPLDENTVNRLIADSLLEEDGKTRPMASLIFKRTAGNPFHIGELLKTIHHDGLIRFDFPTAKWTWELDRIASLNFSDNVVEFMADRLKELPPACLDLLQIAACLGNTFPLRTLMDITGHTASEIASTLWPAINEEIIVPLSEKYRLVVDNEDFDVVYKFHHDRIQQAAYQLIEVDRRRELNLRIGRVLWNSLEEVARKDKIIELARHFNEGLALITDTKERDLVLSMNLQAGKKAQSAVAYHSALQYFKTGISLVTPAYWQDHHRQAFELYAGYAQNAYQTNHLEDAENSIDLLLSKARTNLEKVEVLSLRLRQYNTLGKAEAAIRSGIEGLSVLGMHLPEKPGAALVLKEVVMARFNLGRRKPESLLNEPLLEDAEKQAAARLLSDMGPSAYVLGNDNLYALTALKVVNLSLRHGNCPESSFAYVTFGAILSGGFGDYHSAEEFGKLALALNEKLNNIEYRCRVIAAYGVLTHHFNNHWNTTGDWFRKGIEAGYLSGDLFFLAHSAANCTFWNPGIDLQQSLSDQQKYLKVVLETGYQDALDTASMFLQVTKNYMGLTQHRLTMNDDGFQEEERLAHMEKMKYLSGIGMYHINRAEILFTYGEYEQAYATILEADKFVKSLVSNIYLERLCFLSFVTCSAILTEGTTLPKTILKKRMARELSRMKKWARHNPVNFLHLQLLMQAELAFTEDKMAVAETLYNESISTANMNRWPPDEALANRLAAKAYDKRGLKKAASGYLEEAYFLYLKRGAKGVTDFLKEKYPGLATRSMPKPAGSSSVRLSMGMSLKQNDSTELLDMDTIIRSSQAISGEIVLESLLGKMMRIIMMNAGAERGCLMLQQDEELFVQATAQGNQVTTMQNLPLAQYHDLPRSVVNYVTRMREAVVLDDAAKSDRYAKDGYIITGQPKSVLCSPIVSLNNLYGIIYLENNISVGAFTQDRLRILNLLSSQMAISIQNALLYANLENKVEERTLELRQEKQKSDDLLHNILPEEVANELKSTGHTEARLFEHTTVMFTDFVSFTKISEKLTPTELVAEIHNCYTNFDSIIGRYGLEKIKTIGDAYLSVSGMPNPDEIHAVNAVNAALDILDFIKKRKENGGLFDIRIGLNSGPVVAGVVGVKKFAYDIWGDTVNTAARMESNSEKGRINISTTTYELVKDHFTCEYRGMIDAKNKGKVDMYFVLDRK